MESYSNQFENEILSLLELVKHRNLLIVATVPSKPQHLADKVKGNNMSKLFTVFDKILKKYQ